MAAETKPIAGSAEIKVLYNHIYEYKKGVRNLILYTLNEQYVPLACERLERQRIPYLIQRAGRSNINIYFGQPECLETIRGFVSRPLNRLTPEEDFILGALLGYNICEQCKRFCTKKKRACRA
ncbi:hypothetical protein BHU16_00850 [Tannerella sp. oral taxon 808]|nr:hypothetical protein BHU16_00850 [Tannerella sp. oral taxon 808]PNE29676.1 hypothetical protein BHU09_00560 [Tannerella sp. oral taxon 808]